MSLRVLIVEDNALNSELARDLLEYHGHTVALVSDGGELRRAVAAGMTADVVLMDVLLPDADGVRLVAELRALPEYAPIPMLAVTAHALPGDGERLRAAGFDAVLTKPIDTRTFVAEVERLVAGATPGRQSCPRS